MQTQKGVSDRGLLFCYALYTVIMTNVFAFFVECRMLTACNLFHNTLIIFSSNFTQGRSFV